MTLIDNITQSQSGPGSNINEKVLQTLESFRAGASPLVEVYFHTQDSLVL